MKMELADMCHECEQLDEKIEHSKKILSAMTDQLTIERITALIGELQAQRAALHPEPLNPEQN